MKITILTAALVTLMGAAYASACPMHMEGVETSVENTADGVSIKLSAKDKAVVEKLQAEAKEHAGKPCGCCKAKMKGKHGKADEKGAYTCPMKGCYNGPKTKDGLCPNCHMKLEKKG